MTLAGIASCEFNQADIANPQPDDWEARSGSLGVVQQQAQVFSGRRAHKLIFGTHTGHYNDAVGGVYSSRSDNSPAWFYQAAWIRHEGMASSGQQYNIFRRGTQDAQIGFDGENKIAILKNDFTVLDSFTLTDTFADTEWRLLEWMFDGTKSWVWLTEKPDTDGKDKVVLVPNADKDAGNWTTTPLWSKVDTVIPTPDTGISSPNNPVNEVCKLDLTTTSEEIQHVQLRISVAAQAGASGTLTFSLHKSDDTQIVTGSGTFDTTGRVLESVWVAIHLVQSEMDGLYIKLSANGTGVCKVNAVNADCRKRGTLVLESANSPTVGIPGIVPIRSGGKGDTTLWVDDSIVLTSKGIKFNKRPWSYPQIFGLISRAAGNDPCAEMGGTDPPSALQPAFDTTSGSYKVWDAFLDSDGIGVECNGLSTTANRDLSQYPINGVQVHASYADNFHMGGNYAAREDGTFYDGDTVGWYNTTIGSGGAVTWWLEKTPAGHPWSLQKMKDIEWGGKSISTDPPYHYRVFVICNGLDFDEPTNRVYQIEQAVNRSNTY